METISTMQCKQPLLWKLFQNNKMFTTRKTRKQLGKQQEKENVANKQEKLIKPKFIY